MTDAKKKHGLQGSHYSSLLMFAYWRRHWLSNYQVNHTVDTTVSLDVNPSIEIQVNQKRVDVIR